MKRNASFPSSTIIFFSLSAYIIVLRMRVVGRIVLRNSWKSAYWPVGRRTLGLPQCVHSCHSPPLYSSKCYSSFDCIQQEILKEAARACSVSAQTSVLDDALSARGDHLSAQDISHLESPEQDKAYQEKLSRSIDSFFSQIPLPQDPMAAALAPSREEEEENAMAEALKEAVRDAYWRRIHAKRSEDTRVERAMQKRFPELCKKEDTSLSPELNRAEAQSAHRDHSDQVKEPFSSSQQEVTREMDRMKERIRQLEAKLAAAEGKRDQ